MRTGPLPSEAQALSAYLAAAGDGLEPCLALLRKAAAEKSVAPEIVEGEQATQQQGRQAQQH